MGLGPAAVGLVAAWLFLTLGALRGARNMYCTVMPTARRRGVALSSSLTLGARAAVARAPSVALERARDTARAADPTFYL